MEFSGRLLQAIVASSTSAPSFIIRYAISTPVSPFSFFNLFPLCAATTKGLKLLIIAGAWPRATLVTAEAEVTVRAAPMTSLLFILDIIFSHNCFASI